MKKLTLNRESMAVLTAPQATHVQGGMPGGSTRTHAMSCGVQGPCSVSGVRA